MKNAPKTFLRPSRLPAGFTASTPQPRRLASSSPHTRRLSPTGYLPSRTLHPPTNMAPLSSDSQIAAVAFPR
ncbi:hypothetical protein PHJA_001115700 [Phtheirospermum japonicum]|uniref:Uncharacterized protein n=1 Tax=Phtheirospermum japonicum TaxID=374723 RepID=A0A830BUC3_9LAMI|nr:hypothetical protein PHJA_001115700 [Phtheirospermum japonicum]